MADLFLSYDHDDAARALPIVVALEKAGHAVWWDRHISGGAEYNDEIEAAVEKADAVVVLWSNRSVRSAWVRDEAAEGREKGKLVPVRIDSTKPPMGFRQFQTIDLSGRVLNRTSLQQLFDTIDRLAGQAANAPVATAAPFKRFSGTGWRTGFAVGIFLLFAIAGLLVWNWSTRTGLAIVSVTAAESSQRSEALSSDLVVKLGSLANVGSGKWQLADPQSSPSNADLVFRVSGTGTAPQPQASLVLLDGKRKGVLWSREFASHNATEADLRLQLSLTAGQVLGCALEAREAGGLGIDLLKLFLAGCAEAAQTSQDEPHRTTRAMRSIVERAPGFKPAWSRLLLADTDEIDVANLRGTGLAEARKVLEEDIRKARKAVPDLRELKLVDLNPKPLSPFDYAGTLAATAREKAVAPDMAGIWLVEAGELTRVGRMSEAILSARRGVELDPLSPAATTQLINTLAWSGRMEEAKVELARAERQWPGTGAVRDAQWAFHSRYGDLKLAMTLGSFSPNDPYFRARLEPTPSNVDSLIADIQHSLNRPEAAQPGRFGYALQALGEFGKTEEAFAWLYRVPAQTVARLSYVLFRPGLADVRRDPRFMVVANRIGLLRYWQKSGHWPDFCSEQDLPYDCREEARKVTA